MIIAINYHIPFYSGNESRERRHCGLVCALAFCCSIFTSSRLCSRTLLNVLTNACKIACGKTQIGVNWFLIKLCLVYMIEKRCIQSWCRIDSKNFSQSIINNALTFLIYHISRILMKAKMDCSKKKFIAINKNLVGW